MVATRFLPGERRNITVDYVDAPGFNASAGRKDGRYRIRIHFAAAAIPHFVFNHLFRHAALLPGLGSFAEGDTFSVFERGIPTALPPGVPAERAAQQLVAMSLPSDEQRSVVAALAAQIALSFCVLHEVGHVLNGHASYAALKFAGKEVTEFFRTARRPPIERELRRTWEYEADKTAAAALMQWLTTDVSLRAHLKQLMGRGVDRNLLWLAGFSLRVLFRLLAQVQRQSPETAVHAPPEVRSDVVQIAMDFVYAAVPQKSRKKLLMQSHDHADLLWEELAPGTATPFGEATSRMSLATLSELEDLLAKRRPDYAEHAYVSAVSKARAP